jgi:hypothetical protein
MGSSKNTSDIVTWLTWLALGALALVVAVCSVGLAGSGELLVAFLPVLAPVQVQLIAVGLAFAVCVEVLLVVTGVLVVYIHFDRIFHPSALRLVDVLVGTVVVATLLVIVALFFIPGPPQLFVLVEAGVPAGATIALMLLVLRRLLSRAVAMHVELDEVV